MDSNIITVAKYVAGSQSYGLDTPASDIDYRAVHLVDDLSFIIDPHSYTTKRDAQHVGSVTEEVDVSSHELRHFFHILRAANSNAVELMFNTKWKLLHPDFKHIIANRKRLLDPHKFYKSLGGYMISELKLATGERTGKLGGKRQKAVADNGFSPKNFVQLIRLAWAGGWFFRKGEFPVYIDQESLRQNLLDVKCHPNKYTKEELVKTFEKWREWFESMYSVYKDKIDREYKYDEKLAAMLMLDLYTPLIRPHLKKEPLLKRIFN